MNKSLITSIIAVLISAYTMWLNCSHVGTIQEQLECVATHMKGK